MKKLFLFALLAVVSTSGLFAQEKGDSTDGFRFTDVKVVPGTSVKNQAKSGTCWCFSTNSFLENEILKVTGKIVDLSEMFVVRHCYADKADRFVRMNGHTNFAPGGGVVDNLYVWKKYGMMPEEAYKGLNYGEKLHNHGELDAALTSYVKTINAKPNGTLSTAWKQGLDGILDAYFGKVPAEFTVDGKTYTAKTYANSLGINPDNYVCYSSFTHHPFYTTFQLEVADNWMWASFNNVKIEELKEIVDNAINNGYSVAWAADVSEGGFKYAKGYAVMPKPIEEKDLEGTELSRWVKLSAKDRQKNRFNIKDGKVEEMVITQEVRQEMFDKQETTDDHGMVIEGIAVDQNGKKYYKVKNSWDTTQVFGGYFYVSEAYFMAKTLDIMVNKNAVPKKIADKFKK